MFATLVSVSIDRAGAAAQRCLLIRDCDGRDSERRHMRLIVAQGGHGIDADGAASVKMARTRKQLIVAQGGHGVDAGRAAGGEVAGHETRRGQDQHGQGDGGRIVGLSSIREAVVPAGCENTIQDGA